MLLLLKYNLAVLSSDYCRYCCLLSLQTISSSLCFTGQVSVSDPLFILPSFLFLQGFLVFLNSVLLTISDGDRGSCFSFLRFINVSPAEMSNMMLQGTLVR